jgi:PAS domain S-box-containing protein
MSSEASGRVDASEYVPRAGPISPLYRVGRTENRGVDLSPVLRADLLDFNAWGEILATYGSTMKVAVALTNSQGQILGKCHNAQPVWRLVRDASPGWRGACPFCITTGLPCDAVVEALQTGETVMVHDQAGLTHVAVPLSLGKHHLGAIIAGQVFDRYPEALSLRRVAKEFGVPAQQLWDIARNQRPISNGILRTSGDLLRALGQAFLRQRYSAILEEKLAETDRRFRLLVEEVRDHALFTMDPTGRVTSWNGGAERMLGYVEAEIVGQNFSCFFSPDDIQNGVPETQLRKAIEAGEAKDEGWRVRGNREQFWADVNITALLEHVGPFGGFAIIMQDVTERKKIEIVLEEARQERTRLQEKFLSHVSHELRTPLTAIYFFMTNVLDGILGDLTPEQREHLTLALDNVKQLKDMVSDLLDITRVETHKLIVEAQQASPVKLIADVLSTCRTNAATKNISLRSQVAPGLPFVWADPVRVRQILINLIDNGIKFTPEGGTLLVECTALAEDEGFLRLSVSDTGCGISPENREIIFDRLAQIKSGVAASRSGLGLGLFISRDLVSRHGGRIWVESQLGHGSTFYFTLPVFSLAKLCGPVLTVPNLEAGSVTLIAVDVVPVEATVQADIALEIRRVLERCIHPGHDVLLPAMSEAEPVQTFFIVACTDSRGFEVIANRIGRELRIFDTASHLKPVISSTTLLVAPDRSREEQIGEVTAGIERGVQAHLMAKERLK